MIELKGVSKTYGTGNNETKALDNINVIIDKPFTMLIGQSGSGKTTLLNMIGCLDIPSTGDVIINGERYYLDTPDDLWEILQLTK